MCNETCTVSITDIYGAEWWEANKAELEREWEWAFGLAGAVKVAHVAVPGIQEFSWYMPDGRTAPRIILHRRKPKQPTLREVYGVDEVTIPQGWEWTGEWRETTHAECEARQFAKVDYRINRNASIPYHRLILRERPKKVWFKAEEETRVPRSGDWFFSYGSWHFANTTGDAVYLCATRHEEIDQTVQVVTQADLDGVVGK